MPKLSRKSHVSVPAEIAALARVLDQYDGRYRELRGVRTFGDYLRAPARGADEETLTEPLLASLLEEVMHEELRTIVLAHLSQKSNTPDTALATIAPVLAAKGFAGELHVATQDGPMPAISVRGPAQRRLAL